MGGGPFAKAISACSRQPSQLDLQAKQRGRIETTAGAPAAVALYKGELSETMSGRTATVVAHVDRYNSPSSASGSGIFLAASSSAAGTTPFFQGYLAAPRRGADLVSVWRAWRKRAFTSRPAPMPLLKAIIFLSCGPRESDQKLNFSANWIWRIEPEVPVILPKVELAAGLEPLFQLN